MSEKDVIPTPQPQESAGIDDTQIDFLRQANDPFAQTDMPIALLEFHSPTAALVNMPPTATAQYLIWLIGALTLSIVTVMTIFPLDKVVSTQGQIISTQAPLIVQPFDAAIIKSIDVNEGDYVHKGDILAHLDPTTSGADSGNMKIQKDQYQAEVDRLTAEAEGRDYTVQTNSPASVQQGAAFFQRKAEYNAKIANLDKKISSLQHDLQGFEANAAMYAAQTKVAADVHKMRMQLQKDQVGSKLSTLSAQSTLMETERSQISAQQQAASTRSKLAAQISEKDEYMQSWKADVYKDLILAEHHLAEANSQYQKAVLHNTLSILRADQDAVVLNIAKVSVGSVLNIGQRIMTLTPVSKGLEVETVLSGKDVGFVKLGDKALVKFATFPFQQYGGANATVRTISADSFVADQEGQQNGITPDATNKAFYRLRLRIDRYTLHGVPSFFHPQPGMPVTADIKVGKRTMMQYMLNSFMPLMSNGMREP